MSTHKRMLLMVLWFWVAAASGIRVVGDDDKGDKERILSRLPAAAGEGYIDFSFDQVDVRIFTKLIGKIVPNRKFIVDANVKGKVTVVSPRIQKSEAYGLFVSILESAGCGVVENGSISRIIMTEGRAAPIGRVVGPDEDTPSIGLITKVIHLKHVSVSALKKMLESRVSSGKSGSVGVVESTNHLVITDRAENIRRMEKIVAALDKEGLAREKVVVGLKFAMAEDLAGQLNQAMAEGLSRGEKLRNRLPSVRSSTAVSGKLVASVIASSHANSLILVGTSRQIAEMKKIIKLMDVDAPSGAGRLNAVFLKYLSAEDAAKSISALLEKSAGKKGDHRRIALEASIANNALLVDALPSDFAEVKRLVEQLDVMQEQVHIEVVIAEVSVSDSLSAGVQMASLDQPSAVGDSVVQGAVALGDQGASLLDIIEGSVFPQGITFALSQGSYVDGDGNVVAGFPALINVDALKKDGRLQIRSAPSLVTENNKEATVSITDDIPVLTSAIQGTGDSSEVIQNIERMDVGIKLKITPRVIPGGEIQMVLNQAIEAVIDSATGGMEFTPTIAKREVSTTVTVPDGKTIVIAGLTREDKVESEERVPILGSIPLLGMLFRHTVKSTESTDMLIFVTPRIITDMNVADAVRKELEERTKLTHDSEKE